MYKSGFLKISLWPGLALLAGLFAFALALWPLHQPQLDLKPYGGLERSPDGASYIWAKPGTVFKFNDVPRFTNIYLNVRMSLFRPEGAPPARVELVDQQGNVEKTLAVYQDSPELRTYTTFIVKVPPAEKARDSFYLLVKTDGFRVPGDPRELGVTIESVGLKLTPAALVSGLLFPRPYALAVLLLLIGLVSWSALLRLGPFETILFLGATGFGCGVLANLLAYYSWPLMLVAALILAGAVAYARARNSAQRWLALGAVLALFSAFFVFAPGLPGDVYYWRQVLEPIMKYGPVGVYPQAPRLVYPPGSVFFLWLYGLVTQPFGVLYTQAALKALMGLSHFGLLALLAYMGRRAKIAEPELGRALWLFGTALSLVFVPVTWVQADGWLTLMLIGSLALVAWGRPYLSAGTQVIGILYKAQSWLLLPLYALTYFWQFGWRKALLGGGLTIGLVALLGGLGFAFDPAVFRVFWEQPVVSGESAWGGIRSFNLLHLLGYDQKTVPQPWLALSYGVVGLSYLAILLMAARRMFLEHTRSDQIDSQTEANPRLLPDWLLAAGLFFTLLFFLWVKMHERYLYFGLAFLPFVALWRRDLSKPIALFNLLFLLNLLYAYLPERRDPVPNNFMFWRHALKAEWVQNGLVIIGLTGCLWLAWLYFKPVAQTQPQAQNKAATPAEAVIVSETTLS